MGDNKQNISPTLISNRYYKGHQPATKITIPGAVELYKGLPISLIRDTLG